MNPSVEILNELDRILTALTTPEASGGCPLDPEPCRVALYPGGEVPFDSCEDSACSDGNGQLWANLQGYVFTGEYPCYTARFSAEIGITRCAAKPTASQPIPSVEEVQADTWQQALDTDAILNALVCCEFGDPDSEHDKLVVTGWRPIDPQGGCVGGIWTVTGTLQMCCDRSV